ncbi:MAG TPA: transglutaminase family protein [Hyphomicrobiales bacterium]|nr:transglutaminase family protein [Kaistiaceae bacterium]HQF30123.1 transglutaminase family protein [Hyphomicrobiales bacterium]
MLYDVALKISYTYEAQADAGRHLLRLVPMDIPGEQRLIAGALDVLPKPAEWLNRTDFFGNPVVEIAFDAPHGDLIFKVVARVERLATVAAFDVSPRPADLAREIDAYRGLDPRAPHHFTAPSARAPGNIEIADYARQATAEAGTARAAVEALGLALHRDMRYDPEATTVETSAAEAFAYRHGVCQDFSHVMITGLRAIGIPAGYVSGFLRTIPPKGKPRLEGADAMHAWVMAWCGFETGWLEYDPTNAMWVGTDHIVIARGRDYYDVAPVKGIMRTSGAQTSEQSVDVKPLG